MSRKNSDSNQNIIANGCMRALQLASDTDRLANAPCEQLGVAAAFLARALARFEDGAPTTEARGGR
jgi:hypothetical protein